MKPGRFTAAPCYNPPMNPLEREIRDTIKREGPMTFRDFMDLALYHPTHGYYCRAQMDIGAEGDFYTAANVHQLYGDTLAAKMLQLWNSMGTDGPATFVEIGAGTGQTAKDIITALRKNGELVNGFRYLIVEKSPSLAARQQQTLAEFGDQVEWTNIEELTAEPVIAVVLQIEVIDAFPVHRVVKKAGALREIFVDMTDAGLVDKPGPPSSPELDDYMRRYAADLPEDCEAEVNLEAHGWLRSLAAALERGFIITIDYGMQAAELYSGLRPIGTLVCYHQHNLVSNPYERVGEQDMTAHVNFTALIDRGKELGLGKVSMENQANFLINSGILDALTELERELDSETQKLKARAALKRLILPQGMGEVFRVLVQGVKQAEG